MTIARVSKGRRFTVQQTPWRITSSHTKVTETCSFVPSWHFVRPVLGCRYEIPSRRSSGNVKSTNHTYGRYNHESVLCATLVETHQHHLMRLRVVLFHKTMHVSEICFWPVVSHWVCKYLCMRWYFFNIVTNASIDSKTSHPRKHRTHLIGCTLPRDMAELGAKCHTTSLIKLIPKRRLWHEVRVETF